jgi:thymidylate synthase
MNKEHLHPDGRPYTKEEFVEKIKTDKSFAKRFANLGPVYGKQWRDWKGFHEGQHDILKVVYGTEGREHYLVGIDQIFNLINNLKTNPDSRRLMVSAWNVGELDQMVLPPCHYSFQVYTRELSLEERRELVTKEMFNQIYNGGGPDTLSHSEINQWNVPTRAISLMYNARSQDVPLGTPFNIASYALLLEIIAKIVNMIPDELITNMGDCHIYLNQIDGINEQLKREPFELPTLRINTEFWPTESDECGVGSLVDNVDWLIRGMEINDFQIENYKYHPSIKMPLSN